MTTLQIVGLSILAIWILVGLKVAINIVRREFNHKKSLREQSRRDAYTFKSYVLEEDSWPLASIFSFSMFFFLLSVGWPYSIHVYKKWAF